MAEPDNRVTATEEDHYDNIDQIRARLSKPTLAQKELLECAEAAIAQMTGVLREEGCPMKPYLYMAKEEKNILADISAVWDDHFDQLRRPLLMAGIEHEAPIAYVISSEAWILELKREDFPGMDPHEAFEAAKEILPSMDNRRVSVATLMGQSKEGDIITGAWTMLRTNSDMARTEEDPNYWYFDADKARHLAYLPVDKLRMMHGDERGGGKLWNLYDFNYDEVVGMKH